MSKDNMFLGYARGKVGSLVFSRLKGQQITRAYNASPANPKSRPQMEQRMKLGTAVAYYKTAVGKFFKFAFDDKKFTSSDYNEFIKRNVEIVPYVTKEDRRAGIMALAPLVMSSGSLPELKVTAAPFLTTLPSTNRSIYVPLTAAVPKLSGWDNADMNTIGDVSEQLIELRPNDFQNGDLITTVLFYGGQAETKPLEFDFMQFKVDTTSTGRLSGLAIEQVAINDGVQTCFKFGNISSHPSSDEEIAVGIIVTRNVDGKIYSSPCTLFLNQNASQTYTNARSVTRLRTATDSYGVGFTAILNPEGK